MSLLYEVVRSLWEHDFIVLADARFAWIVYGLIFATLFLENGLLPVSFLPGDSLLLLSGAMVAKGVIAFLPTLVILILAAGLGYWCSYLQGRWLGDTNIIRSWLLHLPSNYHQHAYIIFNRHGLAALLIGRFLAFIRTLLPIIAGLSGLSNIYFQLFNWLSALIWVTLLVSLGYAISNIPIVEYYEYHVMTVLIVLPFVFLVTGLAGSLLLIFRHR